MTGAENDRPGGQGLRGRPLRLLYTCVFVAMVGYGITLTVLPYFTERVHGLRGIGSGTVGVHVALLTSVYALAQLIASPLAGRLADRVGRRPVLLAGLAGMAATQAVFGFVSELWVLYLLRVVGGAATSGLLVASTAYVADSTTEEDRAGGMAWFGTAMSLGLVAGPALGGVMSAPGLSLEAGVLRLDGYSLPFVSAAVLAGTVLFAARRHLPEPSSASPARHRLRAAIAVAPDRRVLRQLLSLVVASQFGLALFEGTFAVYAKNRLGFGLTGVSVAFMVCGMVMGGMQVFAVRALAGVVRPILQVACGLTLMGAGIAALVATRNFAAVLALIGMFALGMALVTPNLSALISSGSGPGTGAALGLKSAAGNVGQFTGPLLGGFLLDWRPTSPFLLSGVVLVVTGCVVGFAHHRPRRQRKAPSGPPARSVLWPRCPGGVGVRLGPR